MHRVNRTNGRELAKAAGRCSGSGERPVAGTRKNPVRAWSGKPSGQCTGCGAVKPLTQYGKVQAHKTPKS